RQITVVALPYQVYLITRSSLMVGLLALAQAGPLVVFSLAGGAIADAVDRRRLLLLTQLLLAATSVALWLGALHHASVLFLFAVAAVSAGIGAVDQPARSATVPRLVSRDKLPAALSLQQVLYQVSQVAGPSAGGPLVGALMTGWVSRIRRQGAAVLCAVAAWGAAICAFGLCRRAFWLGLVFLAMAGAADVFSAVFRNTILQLSVPVRLRGRVT